MNGECKRNPERREDQLPLSPRRLEWPPLSFDITTVKRDKEQNKTKGKKGEEEKKPTRN